MNEIKDTYIERNFPQGNGVLSDREKEIRIKLMEKLYDILCKLDDNLISILMKDKKDV